MKKNSDKLIVLFKQTSLNDDYYYCVWSTLVLNQSKYFTDFNTDVHPSFTYKSNYYSDHSGCPKLHFD